MVGRVEQRAAWKLSRPTAQVAEISPANTLLRSINAAASKMWGSNEERESMSRKVESMTIQYGAPSVFWTLTPNPDSSLVCAFWTGRELPNGRPDKLSKCGEINMPCGSEMSQLIMTNTVVQAQYYRVCCHVLIDILFGWDSVANKPKSRRGIFGVVEALVYALEQQGRLFVHHHGVAWIAGLPKSQSDWDRLLANEDHRRRFERYCASIFAAELPVYNSLQVIDCPREGCSGRLAAVPIPRKFKHVLKTSVPAPIVASCDLCEKGFNESDVVLSIIDKQWGDLDEENKVASSAVAVEGIRHKFAGLSKHAATANIQLSRLLLKDQVHAWTHTRSCVKGRAGTKCRYNFFRDLAYSGGLNDRNEIVHRRRVGNQWLNPFITLWRRVLHFNMDSRILWSGQSLQACRYALQYTVKRQTVLDNIAVVEMAFKRRVSREAALQTTTYSQGIGRLLALAYSSSGVMEIGGPLATAILFEGEAVKFSCGFERLVLIEGLNLLNNIDVEATVVLRNEEMRTETTIMKYLNRPRCLENFSWYAYCSWICSSEQVPTQNGDRCEFIWNDISQLRDHLRAHKSRYLQYPRVPEIVGPRLPDASRLGDEDYVEQTELYYRMAALLYRPFRNVAMFLDENNSARTHFEQWMPLSDDTVARSLERHQQHYICLKHAQEYRERQRALSSEDSSDDEICDDEDVLTSAVDQQPLHSRAAVHYEAISAEFYSIEHDVEMETDTSSHVHDSTSISAILAETMASSSLSPDESFTLTAYADVISRSQIRKFQSYNEDTAVDPADCNNGETASSRIQLETTAVSVALFNQAIQDLNYDHGRQRPASLEPYASIQDVSARFQLNHRQHVAFSLIAVPLLRKITGAPPPDATDPLFDGTPVIVTGAGGTGKSQIIAAVRALVGAWSHPRAFSVVASTGIAASSLQGTTMHSSVGLGINAKVVPKHIVSPSDTLLRQWAPVRCVIADELSMIDLGFFGLWEESLQYANDNREEDYGGLLVVLMFDHCQLRTVKGMPMFRSSSNETPLSPAQDRGRLLYRKITKVVYLIENMRFSSDPDWGLWLASARLGNWTSECRAFMSSLRDISSQRRCLPPGTLQTISTDNATRASTNENAIRTAVRSFGVARKVYVVAAQLSRRVSPAEVALIRQLPDNKTAHIPLFLHIYIGMPVRIKANQCLSKGVANGAPAVVHHIDWDPRTTFSLQPDGTWMASIHPRNVYVDIPNSASTRRFPSPPAHWPTSVMPIHQASGSVSLQGSSLSIRGYPMVPAFGTTVHGVQGETLDAAAVANLRPPHVRSVDPHALYATLSRLRTRHGLHWVGPLLTHEDYAFFRPSTEVIVEDQRLKQRSEATLAHFSRIYSGSNSPSHHV